MPLEFSPQHLKIGQIIHGDSNMVSMDFHEDGIYCCVVGRDGTLHLIDSLTGIERKKIYCKSHGGGVVKYTHHDSCVLLTSEVSKGTRSHEIRYLSLHDNQYLHHFTGHSGPVTSLSMSTKDDNFISASTDRTVLFWDLRMANAHSKLVLPPSAEDIQVAYGPEGSVLGIMCKEGLQKGHQLKLYDLSNIGAGPFENLAPTYSKWVTAASKIPTSHYQDREGSIGRSLTELTPQQHANIITQSKWKSFEFSQDAMHCLVNTSSDYVLLLDAFSKEEDPACMYLRKQQSDESLGCAISADCKYILAATEENDIAIFEKNDIMSSNYNGTNSNPSNSNGLELVHTLTGHVSPVGCIKTNPKYGVMASACTNTALWLQSNT